MNCIDTAWKLHAPELRSWLRRRMDQPQDVDDMMQDLFIKALGQGTKFCNIANARAWLFEVARNALADRLKVRRDMVELPDDLASEESDHDAVELLSACLPRVLSELNPLDREAIDLCDLEGLSQAEYAAKVGLNLSAAKSRLQRARQKMRDRMTQACQVKFDGHGHVQDFVPRPPLESQG
jgi:RNA polymerase sigma-70 factor (ECF subfamily)